MLSTVKILFSDVIDCKNIVYMPRSPIDATQNINEPGSNLECDLLPTSLIHLVLSTLGLLTKTISSQRRPPHSLLPKGLRAPKHTKILEKPAGLLEPRT